MTEVNDVDGAHPNGGVAETSAEPSLSTIPLGFDDAALNIATYLPAQDTLGLHAVNRGWHDLLSKHEELLFENYLKQDFVEGAVLSYVAEKKNLSRKKLYRAFFCKWSLPEQGDQNTRVCITWTRRINGANDADGVNDDMSSLAFIARVGNVDDPRSCALMEWNPDYDERSRILEMDMGSMDQLIVDKCWSETVGGLSIKQNWRENEYWEPGPMETGEIEDGVVNSDSHTLTLHVVDCRYYQVATLLKETEMYNLYNGEGEADFETYYGNKLLPKLYALPPKGSPYHRDFTERDFSRFQNGLYDRDFPPPDDYLSIEHMPIEGTLRLDQGEDDGGDTLVELHHALNGLAFDFDNISYGTLFRPRHVCSFLRAMMKQKCAQIDMQGILQVDASVSQQPDWVQSDTIVDAITSYASFEDQAGKLRLVCSQFGASALRQLESKLDKTKVFGFYRGESWDFFKAQVRRGWSENCLTSKESAIDDALWLASCRCLTNLCKDKESCPNSGNVPQYTDGRSGKSKKTLDMQWAREQLTERGRFNLFPRPPNWSPRDNEPPSAGVECSFKREQMSLWSLCDKVKAIVHKNVDYAAEYYGDWGDSDGSGGRIPGHFQRFYGVSKGIPPKQFIRSLFLVFTKAAGVTTNTEDETANKRARLGPIDEVTFGKAKSNMWEDDTYYGRSITIYRFYSAAHEPFEIHMEHFSGFT